MKKIHDPVDLIEAQMLISMLHSEGITAHLQGAHLLGAIGELPAFGLLGLMVNDEHASRARELVVSYQQATPVYETEQDDSYKPQGFLKC